MSQLAIGTLRLRGTSAGVVPDAQPLLEAVAPRAEDRRVLIVRRLEVPLADPATALDRLEQVRRRAARPHTGMVSSDAVAVEFADEAEALVCLTRDVLAAVARQHWWWEGRLPSYCDTVGETLTVLWSRQPRWVPATLAGLAECGSPQARRALEALDAGVGRVLAAVRAEYPGIRPIAASPVRPVPENPVDSATDPLTVTAPTERSVAKDTAMLVAIAGRVTASPWLSVEVTEQESQPEPRATPGVVRSRGTAHDDPTPPAPLDTPRPSNLPRSRRHGPPQLLEPLNGRPSDEAGPDGETPEDPHPDPAAPDVSGVPAVTDLEIERARRRTVPPTQASTEEPDNGGGRTLPSWAGSGPATQSQMASLLYAINMWRRFGLDTLTVPPASGWSVVEALGRSLLRGLPTTQRRALLGDPLLLLLADLDGRTDQSPTPVRLGAAMRPVRRWLADNAVPATTFARPGRITVSRTHVDVVFAMEQVDLTARVTGIDQDPGWVPELGHLVLFHFEDPR